MEPIPLSKLRKLWQGAGSRLYFGDDAFDSLHAETHDLSDQFIEDHWNNGTEALISRFLRKKGTRQSPVAYQSVTYDLIKDMKFIFTHFPGASTFGSEVPPVGDISFTVITPFHTHLGFFSNCAKSVARAFDHFAMKTSASVEWIVINDDARFSTDDLAGQLPSNLRAKTLLMNNSSKKGIVGALNLAISLAQNEWLIMLDCDDMLRYDALSVLTRYIRLFPSAKYVSSTVIDIDESNKIIRFRFRSEPQSALVEEGMLFGHLKAYNRQWLGQRPYNDLAEGCQDLELALRIASAWPILMIPEPLYYYRWHSKSQSTSKTLLQESRTAQIMHYIVAALLGCSDSVSLIQVPEICTPSSRKMRLEICVFFNPRSPFAIADTINSISAATIQCDLTLVCLGGYENEIIAATNWVNSQEFDEYSVNKIKIISCQAVPKIAIDLIEDRSALSGEYRLRLLLAAGDMLVPFSNDLILDAVDGCELKGDSYLFATRNNSWRLGIIDFDYLTSLTVVDSVLISEACANDVEEFMAELAEFQYRRMKVVNLRDSLLSRFKDIR